MIALETMRTNALVSEAAPGSFGRYADPGGGADQPATTIISPSGWRAANGLPDHDVLASLTIQLTLWRRCWRNKQLSYDDYVALRGMTLPKNVGLECLTGTVPNPDKTLRRRRRVWFYDASTFSIRGVLATSAKMTTDEVARGRFISENDNASQPDGDDRSEVAKKLFPNCVAGQRQAARHGGGRCWSQVSAPGQPMDNFVYIPVESCLKSTRNAPTRPR